MNNVNIFERLCDRMRPTSAEVSRIVFWKCIAGKCVRCLGVLVVLFRDRCIYGEFVLTILISELVG